MSQTFVNDSAEWCDEHAVGRVACGCAWGEMGSVPAFRYPPVSGTQERSSEREIPLFVDVAAMFRDGVPEPPQPTHLRRTDGQRMFYAEAVNVLFGDPECGKTWIAAAAVQEALNAGLRVLWIDADHNGAASIVSRLRGLGTSMTALQDPDLFRLAEPEDAAHLAEAVEAARTWTPSLAVVDSIGELMPMMGLSSNSPDDYSAMNLRVLKRLAMTGAAVVAIDHLAKGAESRSIGQTGTMAKKRAVGGVSYRVTLRASFSPQDEGQAVLTVSKDRHGAVRAASSPASSGEEQVAGVFVMAPDAEHDGLLSWQVRRPADTDSLSRREITGKAETYTVTAEDLAEIDGLADELRSSVRVVKNATGWGSDRAASVLRAWRELQEAES